MLGCNATFVRQNPNPKAYKTINGVINFTLIFSPFAFHPFAVTHHCGILQATAVELFYLLHMVLKAFKSAVTLLISLYMPVLSFERLIALLH